MGLRDALRSLRGSEHSKPTNAATEAPDLPDITDFRPRSDGRYEAAIDPVSTNQLSALRFSGSRVSETTAAGAPSGEYTPSGRFSINARFERPIIYTVLSADAESFTARRTDAGTGQVAELRYCFVADSG